jgi:transcriptional regulator with XRE-family HTH domain
MQKPRDDKSDKMNVRSLFKQIRDIKGLSQKELAIKLDVTEGYIGQLELGHYKKIPMHTIKDIYNKVLTTRSERETLKTILFYEINNFLED